METLKKNQVINNFYLAGGTGLALQLKHRVSIDLDFFTEKDINTPSLIQQIKGLGEISLIKEAPNTLDVLFNKTKVSFFKYSYPLLFPLKEIEGIKVADEKDIGCMKIAAISSRGTKKDFIDLFFLLKKVSFKELLLLFQTKYEDVNYNKGHILKSLSFFEDADKDSMPDMIVPLDWSEVKKYFLNTIF